MGDLIKKRSFSGISLCAASLWLNSKFLQADNDDHDYKISMI